MANILLKIFRSYDFMNNKIINVKTNTPIHNEHLVNKLYADSLGKAKVLPITLVIGDNIINHGFASININCVFRINNNENPDIEENKTINLPYKTVDENTIIIKSAVELEGNLILMLH